jgi:hypothetical protein
MIALLANARGRSTVGLVRRNEFDATVAVLVFAPIHKCHQPFVGHVLAAKRPAEVLGPILQNLEQGF